MSQTNQRWFPRGIHRLLFVSDPSSIAMNLLPDPATPEDLCRWVDMVADSGADTLVQEVYNQGYAVYWQSDRIQYDQRPQHRRFVPMLEAGVQPLSVLIAQSHTRGMRCLAGIRINDDHNFPAYAEFYQAHPEFALALPEGDYYRYGRPLDFSFAAVREYLYAPMQEVASRFEVDGLELCFRDHGYFPRESGRERAQLMTDLLRRVRVMLDEEGRKKGRRLVLGARVFSTLEECAELGLDVAGWIAAGLLDYLSPGDVMFTDFSLPLDEFAVLTRPSTCMLYPGMYPWTSSRARSRLDQLPLSPATCRAFAQAVYGSGGDGLSVYNHFCTFWHAPFYPQSLGILRQLRDPARVRAAERHYIFDPTWGGLTGFGGEGRCPTGTVRANQLVLSRQEPEAAGQYRFRLCEEPEDLAGASLLFRGFGLSEEDELEVRLNGQLIPDAGIGRTRAADAPVDWGHVRQVGDRKLKCIPEQGRIDFRPDREPAFSTRWFALKGCPVAWGWNSLELRLVRSDPQASGTVVVDEVEVFVAPQ